MAGQKFNASTPAKNELMHISTSIPEAQPKDTWYQDFSRGNIVLRHAEKQVSLPNNFALRQKEKQERQITEATVTEVLHESLRNLCPEWTPSTIHAFLLFLKRYMHQASLADNLQGLVLTTLTKLPENMLPFSQGDRQAPKNESILQIYAHPPRCKFSRLVEIPAVQITSSNVGLSQPGGPLIRATQTIELGYETESETFNIHAQELAQLEFGPKFQPYIEKFKASLALKNQIETPPASPSNADIPAPDAIQKNLHSCPCLKQPLTIPQKIALVLTILTICVTLTLLAPFYAVVLIAGALAKEKTIPETTTIDTHSFKARTHDKAKQAKTLPLIKPLNQACDQLRGRSDSPLFFKSENKAARTHSVLCHKNTSMLR